MEIPRINPVGVVEYPEGYETSPPKVSGPIRFFAALILLVFVVTTVVTTVVSLGRYCLTSDGGNISGLPASWEGTPTSNPSK